MLKMKYNLCLFALSWIEVKHKTKHCQGEHSSVFIHKMYMEEFIKRKIVNLRWEKMNRQEEKY